MNLLLFAILSGVTYTNLYGQDKLTSWFWMVVTSLGGTEDEIDTASMLSRFNPIIWSSIKEINGETTLKGKNQTFCYTLLYKIRHL